MMKQILSIVFLFFTVVCFSQRDSVFVLAVHDGDSYKVRYSNNTIEWVRLWGVDCPEVISNHITRHQPYGVQSATFVRTLLKGKTVTIDSVSTDLYDRTVVKVYLDSLNLTTFLISNGYAWAYPTGNKTNDLYLKGLQKQAKDSKLGLWGLPGRKLRPETWRKNNWR